MLRENGKRIWEKKALIITLTIIFFSFFWIGDVKHICTYFKKHIYFTKYKSRTFKWTLFRGDGGNRMCIKSIIKLVIGMFVMAEQS